MDDQVKDFKEKIRSKLGEPDQIDMIVTNEILPKKKLYDVVCNIITKYQDVFNLHKLARMIHLRKMKQLKEKEKLMEKHFHGNGSFNQSSLKFFSSNIKKKTKSDNVSFGSKNSFKFFSNSRNSKTKSDSKLKLENTLFSGKKIVQFEGLRSSLLADFKDYVVSDNKKKMEKMKNLDLFNKKKKNIVKVPVSIVNGKMMDDVDNELNQLNDIEKKITRSSNKEKKSFK